MRKTSRCFTSIVVLLSLLALFAGPVAAAVAPAAQAVKSCCQGCGDEETTPDPAPCSTAECPLLLCLAADLIAPVVAQIIIQETLSTCTSQPTPIPDPYVPSIFHPPTAA